MPYGLFRTSYSHIPLATLAGAKRVPLAHSTLALTSNAQKPIFRLSRTFRNLLPL